VAARARFASMIRARRSFGLSCSVNPIDASTAAFAILLVANILVGCKPREVELVPHPVSRDSGPDENGSGDPIDGLESLRITPNSRTATFDGSALDTRPVFQAIGKFSSGDRDVSALVEWSLSRPELGTIAAGHFNTAAMGGTTDVIARAGDETATAQLRIRLDVVRNRGLSDDAVAAFSVDDAKDLTSAVPQISYPSTDTIVPSDLTHLRYQWRASEKLDRFELSIDSANARLRYYTSDRNWLDDAESSNFLAPSNPGESVRIRVRAFAKSTPDVVYRSDDVTLHVASTRLPGAIYYWSSTARGIKRADLSANHAARLVTDPVGTSAGTCIGCHAVSRDGKHLAVADGTDHLEMFTLPEATPQMFSGPTPAMPPAPATPMDLGKGPKAMMMPGMSADAGMAMPMPPMPDPSLPDPPPMAAMTPMAAMQPPAPEYGWGSFNPDANRLAYVAKGKLHILDTTTGMEVPKLRLPPDTSVAQPDWSPDGASIAVAISMGKPASMSNKLVRASSIARLPISGDGTVGDPQTIVSSAGPDDTLYAPAYSPDGRWIAFARAVGVSKDNPNAQLWIVAADGSSAPVALERANLPNGVDVPTLSAAGNSLPTWANASDYSLAFLVFSSTRDYGDVFVDAKRDQLWASAIDLSALAAGSDPSSPAFWLPFQDPLEDNHRALWSTNTSCLPSAEVCDGRDDDCDRKVDESCCDPSPEDCGDTLDNDCDGVVNEGCGCAEFEVCGNGQDDDCDQHVDEDCKQ
jgi:hypothetical protein